MGTDDFFLEMNDSRIYKENEISYYTVNIWRWFNHVLKSLNIIYAINLYYSQEWYVYIASFFLFYLFLFTKLIATPSNKRRL